MKNVLNGFRDFIARGNAIDLAVGVVVGAAFTSVVTSIVDGIINPIIAALFGQADLSGLWNIKLRDFPGDDDPTISFGLVLNAVLQFFLVALAIYLVVVLPMNALAERRKRKQPAVEEKAVALSDEVLALHEIRDLLATGTAPGRPGDAGRTPTD